jgi:NADH:ubiquinone oxidoreductase subunit 6 (subunit J)
MATVIQIIIFSIALLVFFYPVAAMFSFYGEDGLYRFQKDRFILISSALSVLALVTAILVTLAIPEAAAEEVAGQPLSVADAATSDIAVTQAQ